MNKTFKIVLAEDNAADAYMVRAALEEEGLPFSLEIFEDGEAALGHLARIEEGSVPCPDLFLLDLNLPRYSGEIVLARLRQSRSCTSAAVVILTSSDSPGDKERASILGAEHYFRKPIDLEQYMKVGALVRNVLQKCGDAPRPI